MKKYNILAIESSCDETAMAIINQDGKILSNIISSQIPQHTLNGGVVPELASRLHLENVDIVFNEALTKASLSIKDINYIAVVNRPGLVGALHVGVVFAKSLAYIYNIPILPLDHLAGHIYAASIKNTITFPALALVASGGHTQLVVMNKHLDYTIIGSTLDDAVGECYDKVARVLNIGYPGGPLVDKLAQKGNDIYDFPLALDDNSYNFSYSGLKSSVINKINQLKMKNETYNNEDIACSFQIKAIDILIKKSYRALKKYHIKTFIIAGGVSANSYLREQISDKYKELDVQIIMPELALCGDNAAMIAALAYHYPLESFTNDLSFKIAPNSELY